MKSNFFTPSEGPAAQSTIPTFDPKKMDEAKRQVAVLSKQKSELEEKMKPLEAKLGELEKQMNELRREIYPIRYAIENIGAMAQRTMNDAMFHNDVELLKEVTRVLPEVRETQCIITLEKKQESILFGFMDRDKQEKVSSFFKAFADVKVHPVSYGLNNSAIRIDFDVSERDKLMKGLQLASVNHEVGSYVGIRMC